MHGYYHYGNVHSRHFVDPLTGHHTQNIECVWSRLKRDLRLFNGISRSNIQQYIDTWVFFENMSKTPEGSWKRFLWVIGQMQDEIQY